MSNNRHNNSGLIYGFLFWGCLFASYLWKDYSSIIITAAVSLAIIYTFFFVYEGKKCPHGVFKGEEIRNGLCRCRKCQELKDIYNQEREAKIQEEKKALAFQEEYNKQLSIAITIKREILLSSSHIISNLSPFEFENYIAQLLKKLGFENIIQTPYSNDGGKDIICSHNGITYYVECKHYDKGNKVTRPLMQKLFAAMAENNIPKGMFFTTSTFTSEALEYGKKNNIRTIDGEELAQIVSSNNNKEYPSIYSLPCPKCGFKVDFQYSENPSVKKCQNGHEVKSIPNIKLFPNKPKSSKKKKYYYNQHYKY